MQSYDVVEWGKPLQVAIKQMPVPSGTEVLVKVKFCGVCHSDVHIRDGYFDLGGGKKFHMSERGMQLPVTLGHEPYGTVIAAGRCYRRANWQRHVSVSVDGLWHLRALPRGHGQPLHGAAISGHPKAWWLRKSYDRAPSSLSRRC
jgi:D-arabinose 1-dehydrogenase-like Zn-dependent alcohol dehydrogenase